MKFRVIKRDEKPGTEFYWSLCSHYRNRIRTTPEKLREVLGEPSGEKLHETVDDVWIIESNDFLHGIVSIYDFKRVVPSEDGLTEYHIGALNFPDSYKAEKEIRKMLMEPLL